MGLPVARFVMSALGRFEPEMDEIMGELANPESSVDDARALEEITGREFAAGTNQKPGDAKEAASWVKANAKALGLR